MEGACPCWSLEEFMWLTSLCLVLFGAGAFFLPLRFYLQGPGPEFKTMDCSAILSEDRNMDDWKQILAPW